MHRQPQMKCWQLLGREGPGLDSQWSSFHAGYLPVRRALFST